MKITFFVTLLLSINLLLACNNDSSENEPALQDAQVEAPDMELPIQMMRFDTMEIEPDPDLGPDMDD